MQKFAVFLLLICTCDKLLQIDDFLHYSFVSALHISNYIISNCEFFQRVFFHKSIFKIVSICFRVFASTDFLA